LQCAHDLQRRRIRIRCRRCNPVAPQQSPVRWFMAGTSSRRSSRL
jgi:hypothetical protein